MICPKLCNRLRGSYEVGRYVGANFCLIFGDETQQAGEIAKVNQYFMPLVIKKIKWVKINCKYKHFIHSVTLKLQISTK